MLTVYPGGHLQSLESPDITDFLTQSAILEFDLHFDNSSQVDSELTHSILSFWGHGADFVHWHSKKRESSFFSNNKQAHFWLKNLLFLHINEAFSWISWHIITFFSIPFPTCVFGGLSASPNRAVPKMTFQVQRLLPFICNKCSLLRSFFFCCSQQHSQKGNTLCRTWKTGRLCLCSLHGGSVVHRGNTEMLQSPSHHLSPCWALAGSSLPVLTWRAQNWTRVQDRVEGQGHLPPAAGHSS